MTVLYRPDDLWVLAGMVALGLLSILGAAWAWRHRTRLAERAAQWPSVEGEIRWTEIKLIHDSDSDSGDRYQPRVHYRYRAMGGIHDGDRLRVGARTEFGEEIAAKLAIQPYRAGERVRVYYDPDRPERSVLEPVPTPSGLPQFLVFGIFLLLAAAYILVTITWPSPFG